MRYETAEAFWKSLNVVASEKMNMEATLKFQRILRAVRPVMDDFYEVRNKLVNEYGDGPEGQREIGEKSPRWKEFLQGPYGDLLKQEVPEEAFKFKIKIGDLWRRGADGKREAIEVAPIDLEMISEVIIFDSESN